MCNCHPPGWYCPPPAKLYSIQQTPRGSVVVLGDRIISDYEMPTEHAQQQADWLNDRRKHG